ncbi:MULTISPECIES: hypothetical protein [Pandoraea]|uniref:hypothetical protein n=1 Tax=Pandoraea TaxID=93217 RepID=UPI001F5E004C|nr:MULTISPECIES: hypothetical protein [Pandoraea]MCI3205580.1 hypothetical protein [Pandoraea sp. LA3]MDN4583608.1 hypothetical protein [Pandoraea capi]
MKHRPAREEYRRWLNAQSGTSPTDGKITDVMRTGIETAIAARPELPATLPFAGYVVWFHTSLTFLDIRFDHHRFAIVTQQVENPSEAFYFDHLDAAYGHAADVGEPCLILFAETAGAPVSVVG